LACLLHSLESSVGTLHIGVVVLGVVQLHNFGRDVRLQCVVCVWELRQRVLSHCSISPSEFVEKVLIITNGRTSTFIPAWPSVTNSAEEPGFPQGSDVIKKQAHSGDTAKPLATTEEFLDGRHLASCLLKALLVGQGKLHRIAILIADIHDFRNKK